MNRYLVFSLCAITPLLMHSSNRGLEFENEDSDLLPDAIEELISEDSNEDFDDAFYTIVLEEQEPNNESAKEEPLSLDAFDLADVPMKQESKNALAEAQKQPDVQMEQESKDALADAQMEQRSQEASSKDKMCTDPTMCKPDIEPHQANIRHTEAKGIGYNRGYTTLEGLFTFSRDKYIPFLDLRGHVFDDGRLAANAGIGTRYILNPSKSMVGINTFYDYRNLKHAHFNQWGVGLEGFYDRWELRLNGYLPVGKKKIVSDHHLNGITFKKFQGNNLWINENYTDKVISAKKGGDLEIGVHPFKIMRDYDCLVAAGPYYFGGEGESGWGGKVRLKVEVAKYLFVELVDSYDKVFHNRFQGTLMLSLPFGGKKCYPKKTRNAPTNDCFADNIMAWRGVQPVQRQEIIVAKKQTKSYIIDPIAINPVTGDPIVITFVNNEAVLAGDGTFENPFSTLANAQVNTTVGSNIYVFAGNPMLTGYDTGWQLLDDQRFLGSGAAHDFPTTKGTVTVPIQTSTYPLITNPTPTNLGLGVIWNLITLGGPGTSNNEISGISCLQPEYDPMTHPNGGDAVNVVTKNIIIKDNFFIGSLEANQNQAVVVITLSGNALIHHNVFTNGSGNTGLFITKDATNSPAANLNVTVTNNIMTQNANGMSFNCKGGTSGILNYTISNNVVSDQTNLGINFIFNSGDQVTTYATINSNSIFNNGGNAIAIGQVTSSGNYQIFDNTIFDVAANTGNIFLRAVGAQKLCVNIHDNISGDNTGGGAGYNFSTGGIFAEPFVNNIGTITGSPISVPPCFCGECTLPIND